MVIILIFKILQVENKKANSEKKRRILILLNQESYKTNECMFLDE